MHISTWSETCLAGMAGPLIIELAKVVKWHNPQRILYHWRMNGFPNMILWHLGLNKPL